ncbi:hypothetical protein SAMN03159473_03657 [Pseudomonas sp. NFACC52]|nr:hypothetical protein SAMN03159481_01078 [Pseudomonas sp. NFACC56-3]SFK74472.1 hypothetical protein SAMN03159473_03657 [Pseudomonas sp. NFACC52]
MADPNSAIVAFANQIDDSIAVARMNVQERVASPHFCKHGSNMCRAERDRCCDPEAASKVSSWNNGVPGRVKLSDDPCGILSQGGSRFSDSSTTSRSGQ